jgi:sec-independent protein translocase protein TatA
MFGLGFNEIILIGIFVIVFFYGSNKLIDLARSAGRLTGEYKKGKIEAEKELAELKDTVDFKEVKEVLSKAKTK